MVCSDRLIPGMGEKPMNKGLEALQSKVLDGVRGRPGGRIRSVGAIRSHPTGVGGQGNDVYQ